MFDKLKPKQKALILDLMSRGGEEFLTNLKAMSYDFKEHRKPLLEDGYLIEKKQKQLIDGKEKGVPLLKLCLTDKGWRLPQGLKDLPDLPQIKFYDQIKARIMRKFFSFISMNNVTLAQIFAEKAPASEKLLDADALLRTIKSLKKELFMASGGLRLSVLRKELKNQSRDHIDKLLLELQKLDRIVLYRFDSPPKDEDRKAALIIAGEPRHYLYIT